MTALKDLAKKAFGGLLFLLLVMAALLFLPAWTLCYRQAWIFLAVFGGSAVAITVYLMKKDSKLLERRVYAGPAAEKETSQKIMPALIWRLLSEEKFLVKNLAGYSEYQSTVRHRLVPFIW